jgi:hypothetical protein
MTELTKAQEEAIALELHECAENCMDALGVRLDEVLEVMERWLTWMQP